MLRPNFSQFLRVALLFFCLLFLVNCQNGRTERTDHLGSKQQFEEVLLHYSTNPGDSLKLKAAKFIIMNMAERRSATGSNLDGVDRFADTLTSLWQSGGITPNNIDSKISEISDSLSIYNTLIGISYVEDSESMKSEYLIENIDDAFIAWQTFPWSKNVKFEDFCEYILPYKVYDEPYERSWRKNIMSEYSWVSDSVKNKGSIKEVTILINHFIREKVFYSPSMKVFPAILSYGNISKSRVGKCEHLVTYLTYVLRALGIPAMIDICPVWGNNSSGHTWGSVKDENGQLFTYDALYTDSKVEDLRKTNVIPEGVLRNRKAPKIFRTTFSRGGSLNTESNSLNIGSLEKYQIDVTKEYDFPVADFTINVIKPVPNDAVYAAVYNTSDWRISARAEKIGPSSYRFRNMGTGIVYLPVERRNDQLYPVGAPFLLLENGDRRKIEPELNGTENLHLRRKSNIDYDLTKALNSIKGLRIEASNRVDFKERKLLYEVKDSPEPNFNIYRIKNGGSFRYFRLLHPSAVCRIAEWRMYGKDGVALLGKWNHIKLFSNGNKPGSGVDKTVDGDVLTYFVSDKVADGFVAYDAGVGTHVKLGYVQIYPPNDGNSIEVGDTYELFYWDNYWRSAGRKVAEGEILTFMDCPRGALFRLRNLTKGYKERIFTYDDGIQTWW